MIGKVSTSWSGTSGGPGITQFYFDTALLGDISTSHAQTAVNAMRSFWSTVSTLIPDEILLTVSAVVDCYNPVDGKLVASVTAPTAPTSVAGAATAVYSMAAGVRSNLQTGVVRNGRRVRGSLFIVPAASTVFSNVGTVGSTTRTSINNAGATLMSSLVSAGLRPLVWSRPIPADKPKGPRSGDVAQIISWDTSEKGAVLRGRRD